MKKTKQIDTYYCDYCGKECAHTPEFSLPVKEKDKDLMVMHMPPSIPSVERIFAKQKDICPECQKQIAALVNLLHYADFEASDMEEMIYVLFKNARV